MADQSPRVRAGAYTALGNRLVVGIQPALRQGLHDADPWVRLAAGTALAKRNDRSAIPAIKRARRQDRGFSLGRQIRWWRLLHRFDEMAEEGSTGTEPPQ